MNHIKAFSDDMKRKESILTSQITTMQELKARLIADVVTGKIDVRDVDIPEYEPVVEEAELADDDSAEEESPEDQED